MAKQEQVLAVNGITVAFGGLVALQDISLTVNRGEIFGLLGPNGAGKTTVLNAISGAVQLAGGSVVYNGRDISDVPLHHRTSIGIGRTFQGVELFASLTVQDNLMVGRHHLMKSGIFSSGLFFGSCRREEIAHRQRVEEIIEFFELERYRKRLVGSLPYGIQKVVGVARAMCAEPELLLLDEVASGLNRDEKEDLARFMLRIKHSQNITSVWVEHDVRMVSEIADRVAVLDYGNLVAVGGPEEVLHSEKVQEIFIGKVNVEQDEQAAEGVS